MGTTDACYGSRQPTWAEAAALDTASTNSRPFDLVGLGALNVDRLYTVPRLVEDGEEVASAAVTEAGGSAANTVYGLARLGLRCGFLGTVGDDADADIVLASFRRAGVDTAGIVRQPGATTGTVIALSQPARSRALYVYPGANDGLALESINLDYLARARWLHLSPFARPQQLSLHSAVVHSLAANQGLSLSLGALYARLGVQTLRPLLSRTSVLFASHDEIRQLTGQDLLQAVPTCLETGCQVVVVTFGRGRAAQGPPEPLPPPSRPAAPAAPLACYIATAREQLTVPALGTHRGQVVDTTGAGDAFAAGFLFGLLSGQPLSQCGSLGHVMAGFCLRALGARAGLPTRRQLLARHNRYYPSAAS